MTQTASAVQPSAEAIARARSLNAALQEAAAADAFVAGQRTELEKLEARVTQLRLKVNDIETRRNEVGSQYARATDAERPRLSRTLGDVQHDLGAAQIELDMANRRYERLLAQSQPTPAPKIATVAPPDPFLGPKEIVTVYTGGIILLLPLVLALSRRLWVRGIRRESLDLDNSPRLQRIEQAVESIALEVERIGEAQRFTTKLFAERQLDPAPRIPVPPQSRREPGTITPH
jgi:hypothetical protein